MRYLRDLNKSYLQGKTCLLRINLDVEPNPNNLRINKVVPTIRFLMNNGAEIIVFGHRGRPEKSDPNLSVKPIIDILSEKVGQKLDWLENIRFDPRERDNDETLAQEMAAKGDFFVNDDFATAHHPSATISYLPKYLPSYAGLLIEEELRTLSKIKDNPDRPLVVIVGGIKFADKVEVIGNLMAQADYFLMGSAYIDLDFRKIREEDSYIKKNDSGQIDFSFLNSEKIIMPEDWREDSGQKFDIGPKTIEKYRRIINGAKTVIWSGPVGKVEDERFVQGSAAIAAAIVHSRAFSVAGGGDTEQLLDKLNLKDKFSFFSTGGGAMLEFLAGKKLPALEALEKY